MQTLVHNALCETLKSGVVLELIFTFYKVNMILPVLYTTAQQLRIIYINISMAKLNYHSHQVD